MTILRFDRVTASYGGREPVLTDVSLTVSEGWTGIVGENGSGKTTLARLFSGELEPTSGSVHVTPRGTWTHVCPQESAHDRESIRAVLQRKKGDISPWLGRLGLDESQLERWRELSLGEQKSWQLAAALSEEPDVLLLDEPTNHLDEKSQDVISRALESFGGVGLLISHDRALLDRLTHSTILVSHGRAIHYPGSYSAARLLWMAEEDELRRSRRKAQAVAEKNARQLESARQVETSATQSLSSKRRMKGPKDSDGRSMGRKNLASWAAAQASRAVARRNRALEVAERAVVSFRVNRNKGRSIVVSFDSAHKRDHFALDERAIFAGKRRVLEDVHFRLDGHSRVLVQGENGSGKSTFLRTLVERLPQRGLFYLPQARAPGTTDVLLRDLARAEHRVRTHTLDIAAALGLDPNRVMKSQNPSPGEIQKLLLAHGLSSPISLMVLDEPTSHLDLPTIERLEEALVDFKGAIVLVSHDRTFAQRIANEFWEVSRRTLRLVGGTSRK